MGRDLKQKPTPLKALLYTLRRPVTDGRFSRLIPSFLKRCGYLVEHASLAKKNHTPTPTQHSLANDPALNVSSSQNLTSKATKSLKSSVDISYYNSIDLQILGCINRILFGQKTWVDILENDITNTRANGRYSGWVLSTRLLIISLLQKILPWNNVLTVAEECFYNEIKFGGRFPVLLEHEMVDTKALALLASALPQSGLPTMLVTGTLGHHYGTLDALAWSHQMQSVFPPTLRIVGHAPDKVFGQKLADACRQEQIALRLFDTYRPQEEILQEIANAQYLLCPYHLSLATRHRIPTKFSEAAAVGCTLIFPENPAWVRWCQTRRIAYRLMEQPNILPVQTTNGLSDTWVAQRLAMQEHALLAAIQQLSEA
jgi:hypothetical protein